MIKKKATVMEYMGNILTDRSGNPSSKRWIGFAAFMILIAVAGIDIFILIANIHVDVKNNVPDIIYYTFAGIVGGMFGLTLGEKKDDAG